jgi:sugar O-acyltransferase (sialic acid O-acetyltransferase NeuD family)
LILNDTVKTCAIIGAGGQARAVLGLIKQHEDTYKIKTIIDIHETAHDGETILNVPVINAADWNAYLSENKVDSLFLAIGDNNLRKEVFEKAKTLSIQLPNLISKNAHISPGTKIEKANVILDGVIIGTESHIGNNNIINSGTIIEHQSIIGSHNHIAPGSTLSGSVTVGDESFLGAGCVVIDKINIPSKSIIGAGSTVIKSLDSPGTYVGSPAKQIK